MLFGQCPNRGGDLLKGASLKLAVTGFKKDHFKLAAVYTVQTHYTPVTLHTTQVKEKFYGKFSLAKVWW